MELKSRSTWLSRLCLNLLIVPYGIEIITTDRIMSPDGPLNRTLWN